MRYRLSFALALCASPVVAEDARFSPGDVGCFGFDERTETCAVIRTAYPGGGEDHRIIIDKWGASWGETDYRLTMAMRFTTLKGQYCASPVGAHSTARSFEEPDKPAALGMAFGVIASIMALDWICYEYTRCGERVLAQAYTGKEADRTYTYLFQMFAADDPVTKRLKVRMTDPDEKDAWLSDAVVQGCLPEVD